MSNSETLDFTAFLAESRRNQKPKTLIIEGQRYELPARISAVVVLTAMEMASQRGAESDVEADAVLDMLPEVLGHDQLEDIIRNHHLSIDELMELFQRVMDLYKDQMQAQAQSGNPTPPGTAALTSLRGGRS